MSDLQDFELEQSESPPPTRSSRGPILVVVAIVVVVLLAVFLLRQREPAEETPAPSPAVAESETTAPDLEEPLSIPAAPELDRSDDWVRQVVQQLSAHPELARWLLTEEMIRKFVAAVDNLAEGTSPRSHLEFMESEGRFAVVERDGRYFVDPASYRRYDRMVAVVDSLNTDGVAQIYREAQPLLDQAYRDLGYPEGRFQDALLTATNRLLETPVLEDGVGVDPRVSTFGFADPGLEEMDGASKQFLRLGPENLVRLQKKARDISRAIGIPDSQLAQPSR